MTEEIRQFVAERNAMLRALDPVRFHAFQAKWKLPRPAVWTDPVIVPLIMMHKARLQVTAFSDEEKAVSREWLRARGYSEDY